MDSKTDQWSKLPKHLVIMVAKRLGTSTDVLRLRSVCSSWRSPLSLSPKNNSPFFSVKFPFPIAPNPALNPERHGHFTLSERPIYCIEPFNLEELIASASSKGWMVSAEELKPGGMQLLDPLSEFEFENLPKISSKVLNPLNFLFFEVSKVCNLEFVDLRNDLEITFDEFESIDVKKVVLSSIPAGMDDSSVDFAILAIHMDGKLGFFKLGDKKWSTIDDGQELSHYDDIVFRNGKFYAVDCTGRMLEIDLMLNVRAIESPFPGSNLWRGGHFKYLVESSGDLYLVDKYSDADGGETYFDESDLDKGEEKEGDPDCFIKFLVYKFKEEKQDWVFLESLGDLAFFIGDDCCFSVSAILFSGCKANCIYFADFDFPDDDDHPGYGVGMFDLEKRCAGPLSSFKRYSQIFWPPPTWLEPKASSKP